MPRLSRPADRDGKDGERGDKGNPGIEGPPGPPGTTSGGAVYTRWGRTTCPDTQGTELLYQGIAVGSYWNHKGGGGNYLCLPEEPEYSDYQLGDAGDNYLYGVEYDTNNGPLRTVHNHNAPCAVCYVSTRVTVLMLPARLTCPTNRTLEYNGYLVSERYLHHRSTFECIDKDPGSIPGSHARIDPALFYYNEPTCNGLPCPPYDTQKEITCALCSK